VNSIDRANNGTYERERVVGWIVSFRIGENNLGLGRERKIADKGTIALALGETALAHEGVQMRGLHVKMGLEYRHQVVSEFADHADSRSDMIGCLADQLIMPLGLVCW
jgi:hypothetical protein